MRVCAAAAARVGHGRPGPTFSLRGIAVSIGTPGRVCLVLGPFGSPRRVPSESLARLVASGGRQADSCGVDRVTGWLRRAALAPSWSHSTSGAAI